MGTYQGGMMGTYQGGMEGELIKGDKRTLSEEKWGIPLGMGGWKDIHYHGGWGAYHGGMDRKLIRG